MASVGHAFLGCRGDSHVAAAIGELVGFIDGSANAGTFKQLEPAL
jgi:hypothetical protein